MSRRDLPLLAAALLVLALGLLIGQRAWRQPEPAEHEGGFREWFWQSRSLDLFVQAGLILCAALGIAALLPEDREESP